MKNNNNNKTKWRRLEVFLEFSRRFFKKIMNNNRKNGENEAKNRLSVAITKIYDQK